jgi:hypothetical protein
MTTAINKATQVWNTINSNFAYLDEKIDDMGSGGLSYTATCPAITPVDGVATWSITHNLGTQDIMTALYSGGNKVEHNTLITSNNALTITFKASSSIAAGDYKIVVLASGASSDTSNLADKNLSNVTNTSNSCFDGQWVRSFLRIANSVEYPTSTKLTYDLSSYLPNDSFNYEIFLSATHYKQAVSGQARIEIETELITQSTILDSISGGSTRAMQSVACNILVGSGRTLSVCPLNWTVAGVFTINLLAYRRIGTNS